MKVDVALLPGELTARPDLGERAVVVFDVLRATTSMVAALAAGVKEIRIFGDIESARAAAGVFAGAKLLCGEVGCLRPAGFDLGNSPGAFGPEHAGRTMFMSTTNGTRAIIAARGAKAVLTGALVNAATVAQRLDQLGLDVLLLCAGTNDEVAMEDILGCGAVIEELNNRREVEMESDAAKLARRLFRATRGELLDALREAQGGVNVIRAGLAEDVAFAARLNMVGAAGRVEKDPLRVVPT